MKTPSEILDLQEQFIARSFNTLTKVKDDKLIAWNAGRLLHNTLMAWLIAKRHSLEFDESKLVEAVRIFNMNVELIKRQPDSNFTYYLLACMLIKHPPSDSVLNAARSKASDLKVVVDNSVVPYVYFALSCSESVRAELDALTDKKRTLAVSSAFEYLSVIATAAEPSMEKVAHLSDLFKRRKKDSYYSASQIYGGGPDNDMVCDVEYAAIATAYGFGSSVVPAVNN